MQKIIPCLWFEGNADEAVKFYVSVFPYTKVLETAYYGEAGPMPAGTLLTVTMSFFGQQFMILNGGPYTKFTPAISFIINCDSQAEVDGYWDKLSAGGGEDQCGWLSDKFGVSWQIVPTILDTMMMDPDPVKVKRVTEAMLKMVKLDIAELEKAYHQA